MFNLTQNEQKLLDIWTGKLSPLYANHKQRNSSYKSILRSQSVSLQNGKSGRTHP